MAKTLNKTGITTGNTVEAYHVTQSIDAFTGIDAYDISLSGSFNMTGSINGQPGVINPLTASFAISSSYALSASFATTASFVTSASYALSASFATTASFVTSASYALSASFATTASFVTSASYALSASYAPNFSNTNLTFDGNRTHSTAGNTLIITDGTNDRLGILATETVINNSGANIDFRVESDDNPNTLFIDASTNQIRMGVTGSKTTPSLFFGTDSNTGFYNRGLTDTICVSTNGTETVRITPEQLIVGNENFTINENYAQPGVMSSGWLYATDVVSSNIFFGSSGFGRGIGDKGGIYMGYVKTGSSVDPANGNKINFVTIPSGSSTSSTGSSNVTASTALRIDCDYGPNEPNIEIPYRLTLGALWSGTNTGIGRDSSTGQITAVSSDQRLKTNIQTLTGSLNKIKALRGTQFEWTNENDPEFRIGNDAFGTQIGLIAQEVEQILPEVVKPNGVKDYKSVEYDKIVAVLIEAVKEQQQQIDNLQQQIDILKS
jgi:hypothetical protein